MASKAIFGKPLVTNVYRSTIVEAIVAATLEDWTWCSADYAGHDFERDEIRLEVKQSAFRQTWSTNRLSRPSWDIAARTGFWIDGTRWVPSEGRRADLYVLALHTVVDDRSDHRDPLQWNFYVVASHDLPATKTIGVAAIERLTTSVGLSRLAEQVEEVVSRIDRNSTPQTPPRRSPRSRR